MTDSEMGMAFGRFSKKAVQLIATLEFPQKCPTWKPGGVVGFYLDIEGNIPWPK